MRHGQKGPRIVELQFNSHVVENFHCQVTQGSPHFVRNFVCAWNRITTDFQGLDHMFFFHFPSGITGEARVARLAKFLQQQFRKKVLVDPTLLKNFLPMFLKNACGGLWVRRDISHFIRESVTTV